MKNQKTLANRTIDFCDIDDYIHSNIFFKSLLHHLLENLKFALKCPFKKVSNFHIFLNQIQWFYAITVIFLNTRTHDILYNSWNLPYNFFLIRENFKKMSSMSCCLIIFNLILSQGIFIIKEHNMPNYVVPGFFQMHDRFLNTQKVKTRIDNHIKTIFESSYITEVCEFDWKIQEFVKCELNFN